MALELLAAGGSRAPEEVAKIAGLDLTDPGFWDAGLALVQDQSVPGGGVSPGTALYKDLADLHDGDLVRFTGTLVPDREDCYAERSFRLHTSLKSPTFELRLEAIGPD